jgi:hypothetical protein
MLGSLGHRDDERAGGSSMRGSSRVKGKPQQGSPGRMATDPATSTYMNVTYSSPCFEQRLGSAIDLGELVAEEQRTMKSMTFEGVAA